MFNILSLGSRFLAAVQREINVDTWGNCSYDLTTRRSFTRLPIYQQMPNIHKHMQEIDTSVSVFD